MKNLPTMHNLKQVRLHLHREAFDARYRERGQLEMLISQKQMPKLEVLELEVHCNLKAGAASRPLDPVTVALV